MERRVPVEICKRRRFDENSIFLSRGRQFRKAGEKRRTTLFRRTLAFDALKQDSNSTSTVPSTTTTTLRPNVVINPVTEPPSDSDAEEPERDIDISGVEL